MLEGCELHEQTAESVAERWVDPHLEDAGDRVGLCSCCGGPCLVLMRLAVLWAADGTVEDVLPGGIAQVTRCTRCEEATPEQEAAIMERLMERA